jgi:hypothetical protein
MRPIDAAGLHDWSIFAFRGLVVAHERLLANKAGVFNFFSINSTQPAISSYFDNSYIGSSQGGSEAAAWV